MIEQVSPDDTAKLDEIDARVWCYLNKETFTGGYVETNFIYNYHTKENKGGYLLDEDEHRLTRSRDALKAIRPESCEFIQVMQNNIGNAYCQLNLDGSEFQTPFGDKNDAPNHCASGWLPTEELAELHAIIQAIAYKRNQDANNRPTT